MLIQKTNLPAGWISTLIDIRYRHYEEPDAGNELPPRLSARRTVAIWMRHSRFTLRFQRQSLSFALGVDMKHLFNIRFPLNRKFWLLTSGILFVGIGMVPFDTRLTYKIGYNCPFTIWVHFFAHPEGGIFLAILVLTSLWILVSILLGWLATALFSFVKTLCADGPHAQLSAPPVSDPAEPQGNKDANGGPPSVS